MHGMIACGAPRAQDGMSLPPQRREADERPRFTISRRFIFRGGAAARNRCAQHGARADDDGRTCVLGSFPVDIGSFPVDVGSFPVDVGSIRTDHD
jgi:hypothetical protein